MYYRASLDGHLDSFADIGLYSQSYGFSSSHICESWTIKKAESRRTDTFKL